MATRSTKKLEEIISSFDSNEPFFVLRARDSCAADTVENHAIRMKVAGRSNDAVRAVYQLADDMRQWRSDNFDRNAVQESSVHTRGDGPDKDGGSD
jgi:hypothetical protein